MTRYQLVSHPRAHRTGTLWVGLLRWLSVAAGTAASAAPADEAWQADADAWQLLYLMLDAQRLQLAQALHQAEARGETTGGDGVAVRALAAGALRAAEAAEAAAQLGAARMAQGGSLQAEV